MQALRDVDLTIADGELIAIQGPTGGGKSTLLQMLGALDRPTAGTVVARWRDDLARSAADELAQVRAEQIGFVFQNYNLIPTLTAQQNVETALVPLGVGCGERHRRAQRGALPSRRARRPRRRTCPASCPAVRQQRVAIARALVKSPTVLLADEPTGNLDEQTRDEIIDLVERLWRERGLTVVIVTHDTAVARRTQRRLQITDGEVSENSL